VDIKRLLYDESGESLIELTMVMVVMILFGATIYTLILAGSSAQRKIIEEKNAQSEARVASSYVSVRLRQNDRKGAVVIVPTKEYGNAILIKGGGGLETLDRWILWSDGELREFIVDEGQEPLNEPGMYSRVASVKGFDARAREDGMVISAVSYDCGGETREITSEIYVRSGLGAP
jgi:hypothetical protein